VSFLVGLGEAIDKWSNLALSVICDYVGWRGFFKAVREGRINPSGQLPDHAYQRLHEPSQADAIVKASSRLVYWLRRFDLDTRDVKRLSRWLIRWAADPVNACDKLPPPREIEAIGHQVLTELRAGFDKLSQTETPKVEDAPEPQAGEQPEYVFRRDGDGWFIKAFGERGRFPGLVGLERLARLVRAAGRSVPMTELVSGGGPKKRVSVADAAAAGLTSERSSSAPLVDEQGVKDIEEKVKEYEQGIAEAERCGDVTMANVYRNELAGLLEQKSSITMPSGKPRNFPTEIDRLRPAIHQSISRACQRLRNAGMKNTAAHFEVSIRAEGDGFIYSPSPPIRWQ